MKRQYAAAEGKPVEESTWPQSRTTGSVTVKVYRRERADGKAGYEVADYSTGTRKLRSFTTAALALAEAKRLADLLASGDAEAAAMTNKEAASFGRAVELLRPTGLSLELAASIVAESIKKLGGNRILVAVDHYVKTAPDKMEPKTVAEVAAELVARKERDGKSIDTVSELRRKFAKFSETFGTVGISTITTQEVQTWLDKLSGGEQNRKNFKVKIGQLFNYAERRNYILKAASPVSGTEEIKPADSVVTIYTADEVEKLLKAASPEFRACIAIGAFSGLRTSEVQRLKWEDIEFTQGHIKASAKKAGTPSRRFVPLTDNLRAWLKPSKNKTGFVWMPAETERKRAREFFNDAQIETAKNAGTPWKKNALRHSYISYRLALDKNTNAVALLAGNSPETIFAHYNEPQTEAAAKAWFNVAPKSPTKAKASHKPRKAKATKPEAQPSNVIQLPSVAA